MANRIALYPVVLYTVQESMRQADNARNVVSCCISQASLRDCTMAYSVLLTGQLRILFCFIGLKVSVLQTEDGTSSYSMECSSLWTSEGVLEHFSL